MVVIITITVIVTVCAGLSPETISAVAALLTAVALLTNGANAHQLR
ncbi:hypothetical protein [Streptomyces sp. RG80]